VRIVYMFKIFVHLILFIKLPNQMSHNRELRAHTRVQLLLRGTLPGWERVYCGVSDLSTLVRFIIINDFYVPNSVWICDYSSCF
jgi:hypothetical protein